MWEGGKIKNGDTRRLLFLPIPIDLFPVKIKTSGTVYALGPLTKIISARTIFAHVSVATHADSLVSTRLFLALILITFFDTSANNIYCVSGNKCCMPYIGETCRRLSNRLAEHLRPVGNNVDELTTRL